MGKSEYEFFDRYRSSGTGISDIDFKTLRAMARPFTHSTSKEFHDYWNETKELLKKLFRTHNSIVAITGAIRVCFDAIIGNIVQPGDKILVLTNGYWGSYVTRVVKAFNGVPIIVKESPSRAINPKKVEEALSTHRDVKAVSVMHVETDTGIVHPVKEIGDVVMKQSNALYIVDCATSFGGMMVNVDEWGADFCFTGSHKCLAAPIGLGITTVSDKAWKVISRRETPIRGTYIDLLPWKAPIRGECQPPLPAVIVHAIRARVEAIVKDKPERIFRKHEIVARALRMGLIEMGLDLLSETPNAPPCSNVVTVVKFPKGVSPTEMTERMRKRYLVGFGPSPYRKGVFQLGTINESQVNPRHILYLLTSIGLSLSQLGVKVKLEEAIQTADRILQEIEQIERFQTE